MLKLFLSFLSTTLPYKTNALANKENAYWLYIHRNSLLFPIEFQSLLAQS